MRGEHAAERGFGSGFGNGSRHQSLRPSWLSPVVASSSRAREVTSSLVEGAWLGSGFPFGNPAWDYSAQQWFSASPSSSASLAVNSGAADSHEAGTLAVSGKGDRGRLDGGCTLNAGGGKGIARSLETAKLRFTVPLAGPDRQLSAFGRAGSRPGPNLTAHRHLSVSRARKSVAAVGVASSPASAESLRVPASLWLAGLGFGVNLAFDQITTELGSLPPLARSWPGLPFVPNGITGLIFADSLETANIMIRWPGLTRAFRPAKCLVGHGLPLYEILPTSGSVRPLHGHHQSMKMGVCNQPGHQQRAHLALQMSASPMASAWWHLR